MPRGHSNHRSSNQRRSLSYCLSCCELMLRATHFYLLSSGLLSRSFQLKILKLRWQKRWTWIHPLRRTSRGYT